MSLFQYHTFLHHSQTCVLVDHLTPEFQYHTFLHHSQTGASCVNLFRLVSVPYVFTSFSNQTGYYLINQHGFSTIRFYIILKRIDAVMIASGSFSTIRFYIILKPPWIASLVSQVSVPYVFTSFSNQIHSLLEYNSFQYHTFLHHSQTSNSKMNRHHLRKTRYSNTFNRFHIDLYL